MGVLDGPTTIGPEPGWDRPACPTCGEPTTGWLYTARSGYRLIPCEHYIPLAKLHELTVLPETLEVSGGSPAYPKRSQMTWSSASVTVPAGSTLFAPAAELDARPEAYDDDHDGETSGYLPTCDDTVMCDELCGAQREPSPEDPAEVWRALIHYRDHQVAGGCSHGN